ncbi:unnamed protein product [Bursaphelenchus okinawaensis]|uniref:TGF-beta family profile domain-containing protein n=1 Tax=Bursaphelenchus okinawaensis TaxID=465554 RepID=A0A811L962_9BILA|nr:unnamed protein product [Bursaphelenchus okinawaensis]CAG9120066.1 unnamed protein product [Bursaphelenchus okinawaensis]
MRFFFIFLLIYLFKCEEFYVYELSKQSTAFLIDLEQAQVFQSQILLLLGLERPSNDVRSKDEIVLKFMASLYRVTDEIQNVDFMFDSRNIEEEIFASDTIISFVPTEVDIIVKDDLNVTELTFEVNKDKNLEIFAGIYYIVLEKELKDIEFVTIHYTHKRKHYCSTRRLKQDSDENVMFASFNGTNLFTEWFGEHEVDKRIVLQLHGHDIKEDDLSSIHFFGVGFFFTDGFVAKRQKRNIDLENQPDFSHKPESSFLSLTLPMGNSRSKCLLKSLYVDFKDLGWDSWVIAPSGYQADYCEGECSFPLDADVFPSNHAVVQSLLHLIDDKSTQPAECAATEMREQSILFMNNQNNIVMKKYQNMRVNRCGCR